MGLIIVNSDEIQWRILESHTSETVQLIGPPFVVMFKGGCSVGATYAFLNGVIKSQ